MLSHADTMGIPVWEAAAEPGSVPGLGTAAQKALGRFMSTMERLRERVEGGAPVGDLVSDDPAARRATRDALEAERTIEAQGRLENLEELVRVAREYDATAEEGGSLGEFLQQIALLADADSRQDDEGLVTLMTMHNAKGLEYPIVFMIGMEDGVFPHSRALDEGAWRRSAGSPTSASPGRCATSRSPTRAGATRSAARSRSASARASSTRSRAS